MAKFVRDTFGRQFELLDSLGQGGQGEVFAVVGQLAIKVIRHTSHRRRDELKDQFRFIRNLPEIAGLIKPKGLLREPDLGYWMELKSECIPISRLIKPPSKEKFTFEWFNKTGGLKKRLRVLTGLAEILSVLHSNGLAYSDLSCGNVLVSEDPKQSQVWLIDTDNLQRAASIGSIVCTKGYAAPEIVTNKSPVNSLSDAHSFAVLAFKVLTGIHPLIGEYVENGEPELEDDAFQGKLPWVDHPENSLNSTTHGIPREKVLSKNLKELFNQAFTDGLNEPTQRPSLLEWVVKLRLASDMVLECPACQHTYFRTAPKCPNCSAKAPRFVQLAMYSLLSEEAAIAAKRLDGSSKQQAPISAIIVQENSPPVQLNAFQLGSPFGAEELAPILELQLIDNHLSVRLLQPALKSLVFQRRNGQSKRNLSQGVAYLPISEFLQNGSIDRELIYSVDDTYKRRGQFNLFGEKS